MRRAVLPGPAHARLHVRLLLFSARQALCRPEMSVELVVPGVLQNVVPVTLWRNGSFFYLSAFIPPEPTRRIDRLVASMELADLPDSIRRARRPRSVRPGKA